MFKKSDNTLLKIWWICLLALTFVVAEAKEIPKKPNPPRLVNDYVGVMSAQESRSLERKLVAYDDSTSNQFAIVIEESLEGDDIFDYSLRIAEAWEIGRKGKDNGILIYIASGDRKLFIHVGPGLQGRITDALSKRIINNVLSPAFREGNFYDGLDRATDILIQLASGEFQNTDPREEDSFPWQIIVVIAIVILILWFNRNDGGGYYRGGRYDSDHPHRRRRRRGGGWIILGDPWSGGWGGRSSGGGFGGFGGGGGFGGFGGGGFDGGGAFGSW